MSDWGKEHAVAIASIGLVLMLLGFFLPLPKRRR